MDSSRQSGLNQSDWGKISLVGKTKNSTLKQHSPASAYFPVRCALLVRGKNQGPVSRPLTPLAVHSISDVVM